MSTVYPGAGMSEPTVLIVDDDADMRLLARIVLEKSGIDVAAEALDGLGALETLKRLNRAGLPTVILLDNQMPGLSGLDVAGRILAERPDQLIVLFTACLDAQVAARAAKLGIVACVSKPEVGHLPRVIRDVVAARARRDAQVPHVAADGAGTAEQPEAFDAILGATIERLRAAVARTVGEDDATACELLDVPSEEEIRALSVTEREQLWHRMRRRLTHWTDE
jgi:CheY-like chemotaxis protein